MIIWGKNGALCEVTVCMCAKHSTSRRASIIRCIIMIFQYSIVLLTLLALIKRHVDWTSCRTCFDILHKEQTPMTILFINCNPPDAYYAVYVSCRYHMRLHENRAKRPFLLAFSFHLSTNLVYWIAPTWFILYVCHICARIWSNWMRCTWNRKSRDWKKGEKACENR